MFLGGEQIRSRPYAEATQRVIDSEVARRLLREAEDAALLTLHTHTDRLDALAHLLLEQETIDGAQVSELVGRPIPGGPESPLTAMHPATVTAACPLLPTRRRERRTVMSDLTLGTPVTGSDEPIGRLTEIVCDPTTDEISHLVVNADDVPGSERLVSIERLAGTEDRRLTLAISRHQFFDLKTLETV